MTAAKKRQKIRWYFVHTYKMDFKSADKILRQLSPEAFEIELENAQRFIKGNK